MFNFTGNKVLRIIVFIIVVFVSNSFAKKDGMQREIVQSHTTINCTGKMHTIVHFTATSKDTKEDVIHYIISGIVRPTILIRHVFGDDVQVNFNHSNICNSTGQGVVFSDDPKARYSGIMISKVFPFLDKKDQVYLPGRKYIYYDADVASNFTWTVEPSTASFPAKGADQVKFLGKPKHVNASGSLDFTVKIRHKDGDDKSLPGYPMRANLSEFRLELNKLPDTIPNVKVTSDDILRYSAEVFFFTGHRDLKEAKYETEQSIDDEYTPGTFKVWAINLPLNHSTSTNMYGSWKPVAYRKSDMAIDNDAFAYNNIFTDGENKKMPEDGKLPKYTDKNVRWTLAHCDGDIAYFGLNVSFGTPKDGGYEPTKYITWFGMVGHGKPPLNQQLSDFAITVITIGLGGPAVGGLLIGIFVALIRKLRGSNSTRSKYDMIN